MSNWLFTLRGRFGPSISDGWEEYLSFSQCARIKELVTLDSMMCPEMVTQLCDEDWCHNVHEDFRIMLFRDADYLLARQPVDPLRQQVLAILERPTGTESVPAGFSFCGFDIVDSYVGNSCLTNCGPIPEAFDPSMVNEFGLLSDRDVANEICGKMRRLQPDDPHLGQCEVWSIARALPKENSTPENKE